MSAAKLQQIIKLLKFLLTLEDLEVIKCCIESIIEILEEQNGSNTSA